MKRLLALLLLLPATALAAVLLVTKYVAPAGGGGNFAACMADPSTYQTGGKFFNSCETGCGSGADAGEKSANLDADVLFCDDFERTNVVATDGDHGGESGAGNYGWSWTIYGDGTPWPNASGEGLGSSFAANFDPFNFGSHGFPDEGASEETEFYLRYYVKPSSNYSFGHEKTWVTVNNTYPGSGGICFGNWHHQFGDKNLAFQCAGGGEINGETCGNCASNGGLRSGGVGWLYQNQGNDTAIEAGQWNFVEGHIKLNTASNYNGTVELWVDNCGADGSSCTGTPTLVMQYTDVRFTQSGYAQYIKGLWFENWSNPQSSGDYKYFDNVVISRSGPIGFCEECLE